MLTEKSVLARITILENRIIELRNDIVIYRDDVEISRIYQRRVLTPGEDVSKEIDQDLVRIIQILWTPEVIQTYLRSINFNPTSSVATKV